MEQIRERVLQIMDELEKLSEHDYSTFELALVLFLRSDKFQVKNYITDGELKNLDKMVSHADSLMSDDLKDAVDDIIEGGEDYE